MDRNELNITSRLRSNSPNCIALFMQLLPVTLPSYVIVNAHLFLQLDANARVPETGYAEMNATT
jgi:hypothetical protein